VRLGPATTLPAGNLPPRVEIEVGGGVYMRFALIPSGRFLMGSPPSEVGRVEDERQHEVIISQPFYMGVTAVTQEQYEAVIGKNPSQFEGVKNPVESVSWDDATAFCRRLSERSGHKVRLPTESEWEYACRAGTTTPFNTGQILSRNATVSVAYSFPRYRKGRSDSNTLPAGSYKPNAWGLYDTHGIVLEWCSDWYGEYPVGAVSDPTGPETNEFRVMRVMRGGGWGNEPADCRSASRDGKLPGHRFAYVGFRVALVAVGVD
jgi:formylglycine-generating enzyme required for sulfatase activity